MVVRRNGRRAVTDVYQWAWKTEPGAGEECVVLCSLTTLIAQLLLQQGSRVRLVRGRSMLDVTDNGRIPSTPTAYRYPDPCAT